MNGFAKCLWLAAGVLGVLIAQSDTASAQMCPRNQVYSSSMGQCIPRAAGAGTKVFIPHGCPYNLDKSCVRLPNGQLIQCRCVS